MVAAASTTCSVPLGVSPYVVSYLYAALLINSDLSSRTLSPCRTRKYLLRKRHGGTTSACAAPPSPLNGRRSDKSPPAGDGTKFKFHPRDAPICDAPIVSMDSDADRRARENMSFSCSFLPLQEELD